MPRRLLPGRSSRAAVLAALAATLLVAYLNAFLELRRETTRLAVGDDLVLQLPDADVARAAGLNYSTAVADLMWVTYLVNFGENRRIGVRIPQNLIENATTIAELDPLFYAPYEWAPSAKLNNLGVVREEDIVSANSLLRRGMEAFPADYELPYSAALNYIGYSSNADPERRKREVARALELLEEVVQHPEAPSDVTGTASYFIKRFAQLEGEEVDRQKLREREIEFYVHMLLHTTNAETRQKMLQNLRALGANNDELVRQFEAHEAERAALHAAHLPYVPESLWMTLYQEEPAPGGQDG